ncbi:hypothetical protein M885DRAFT_615329 [Pelagophyceae sp. CCMP2097]|nr:hypothetical protein M885DRAFT_615329 [Pelagophyceae sp. CCMP2097]
MAATAQSGFAESQRAFPAGGIELFSHDDCLATHGPAGHQESPARVRAIVSAVVARFGGAVVRREDFECASEEDLLRVHSARYLRLIEALCDAAGAAGPARPLSPALRASGFFGDAAAGDAGGTWVCGATSLAAKRAAGAGVAAVARAATTPGYRGFAAVRPPGHHATREGYDADAGGCGFCVLNNVAVAAAHARDVLGLRVAIVDFDVHHGNGTEAWVRSRPDEGIFFASTHLHEVHEDRDFDFFPGSGATTARKRGETAGPTVFNVGIRPTWCDCPRNGEELGRRRIANLISRAQKRFIDAVDAIAARLRVFEPDLLLFSAGFDAARGDAGQERPPDIRVNVDDGMGLELAHFYAATAALVAALPDASTPVVSMLEGGYGAFDGTAYDTALLGQCVCAHLDALNAPPSEPSAKRRRRLG